MCALLEFVVWFYFVATEVLVCSFRSLAVMPVDKYSILRKQILQLAMVGCVSYLTTVCNCGGRRCACTCVYIPKGRITISWHGMLLNVSSIGQQRAKNFA